MKCRSFIMLLLILCIALVILPINAEAETVASGTCGDNLIWVLDDGGALTISGTGEMYDYQIDEISGKPNSPWYESDVQILAVNIQQSVTSIGDYAFAGDTSLNYVSVYNVTTIGDYAFRGCTGLNMFSIASWELTYIGDYAFYGCEALQYSLIQETLTYVGENAFYGCKSITSIEIPYANISWGSSAFANSGVTEVYVGYGVTNFGNGMFSDCTSLENVYIPNTVTEFADCFEGCTNLTIYAHADSAAANYASEQSIAFESVKHAHFEGMNDPQNLCKYCGVLGGFSETLMWSLDDEGTLTIFATKDMTESTWSKYKDQVKTIIVEEGTTGAVGGFYYFENLTRVSLPSTVTKINSNAFGGCTQLKEINFPENLLYIYSGAFSGCVGLTEVHLPASVMNFGSRPFGGCSNLTGIWVDESNPYFTNDTYGVIYSKDMTKLVEAPGKLAEDYVIPATVTAFSDGAFDGCSLLTSATIPEGVSDLVSNLFSNCTSLCEVMIPESVEYIWMYPFDNCTSLKTIYFAGDAPGFTSSSVFTGLTASVYYPASNETWTSDVMQNYGGEITWVKCGPEITTQPQDVSVAYGKTAKVTVKASGDGLTYQWYFKSATAESYTKSSKRTATYSTTMTEARDGYQVYCVITDSNGYSVQSDVATLSMKRELTITQQPVSASAAEGQTIKASVYAIGEGLTYQWYFKSATASSYTKSSNKTATYSTTMTEARDGYKVYCVVKDAYGNSVKSNVATLTMVEGPVITKQPVSTSAAKGETVKVTVKATGDGVKYQWYFKSASASSYTKSSNKTATYSTTMTEARDGYKVYCVVTDKYGNSVKTNTVTLSMKTPLAITKQPVNASAAKGETIKASVTASGDGLTYQWYFKSAAASSYTKSSNKTATYSTTMTEARDGYKVYCVVTDKYSNSVKTNTVTLSMKTSLAITKQPEDVTVAEGETVKATVKATGDGLTYQWYFKSTTADEFTKSSNRTATYSTTMTEARDGYKVYCFITDKYGNSVKTNTVTLKMS